jgi:hypothetical protein
LPVAEACELVRQAALGLQAVHESGLVHRDVKPSNLLLADTGQVKVLDLGVALLAGSGLGDSELTGTGQVVGTADYMAPEQGEQSHTVDIRADVYSLGCTLYKLLTGEVPFNNPAHNCLYKKVRAHVEEPIPEVRGRSDVPPALTDVLKRLLAKQPDDRFATPAEAADALEAFSRGADLLGLAAAASSGRAERVQGPGEGLPHHQATTTPHAPKAVTASGLPAAPAGPLATPRRRWLAPALALVLLGGLGIAAFVVFRRAGRDPGPPPDPSPPITSTAFPEQPAAPGVWNPLLEREPAPLRWPSPGKNSFRLHRPEQREIALSCEGLGMLGLGHTTAPSYRIAVTVQQNPWTGGVGVFFGYQPRVFEGKPARFYQLIELVTVPQPQGGPLFRLDWKTVHCGAPPLQHEASQLRGVSATFRVSPQEHRLELAVGPKGLDAVSWDGKVLPRPRAAVVSAPPPPADYRGEFGLYVRRGSGVFREAVYLYREVP